MGVGSGGGWKTEAGLWRVLHPVPWIRQGRTPVASRAENNMCVAGVLETPALVWRWKEGKPIKLQIQERSNEDRAEPHGSEKENEEL